MHATHPAHESGGGECGDAPVGRDLVTGFDLQQPLDRKDNENHHAEERLDLVLAESLDLFEQPHAKGLDQ